MNSTPRRDPNILFFFCDVKKMQLYTYLQNMDEKVFDSSVYKDSDLQGDNTAIL